MNKILVTGGVGLVGVAVVQRLLESGQRVRIIDRQAEQDLSEEARELIERVEYATCDINDIDRLREQMAGCDQVVHLAALPSPAVGRPEEVFRVNADGTFKVFQAAAELGIRRVVQASSINALGLYYGVCTTDPLYFPVDEQHPHLGTDAYSFSKWVVEEIGEYFWRREGISSVALRLPGVVPPRWREHWGQVLGKNDIVARLLALPEPERRAWIDENLAAIDELRRQRQMESREFQMRLFGPHSDFPPDRRWLLGTRNNMFTLIDARDAAQAVEKSLSAGYDGAHALFVNDKNNLSGYDSELLLELFFPQVKARKRPLVGKESLVSIEKARRLIGFEPEFGWES
jgi:nucleoside-diphosphate-sugar epimerase